MSEELLVPRPTPKLERRPLSAVCDCLVNTFVATLHIWRPSPPSVTRGPVNMVCSVVYKLNRVNDFEVTNVPDVRAVIHEPQYAIC